MDTRLEGPTTGTNIVDVLDRVLDKGIVIDAWVRVSLVGIDLITVEARVVVASIETYLHHSDVLGQVAPSSWPAHDARSRTETVAREYPRPATPGDQPASHPPGPRAGFAQRLGSFTPVKR